MSTEKTFDYDQTAAALKISRHTLKTWYLWESKQLREGSITEHYLPRPHIEHNKRGNPRYFTSSDIKELKKYKETIVVGRKGKYGRFSNPNHKEVQIDGCSNGNET